MPEAQWDDLLVVLRRGLAASEPNGQRRESIEVLRGDAIAPGLQLDQIVSVYLHGDCVLLPGPRSTAIGALGWVYRVHDNIAPFIHVDCAELTQMLGSMALTLPTNRRHQIMAEAITRVVMHEWVHVATQSAAHAPDGIAKSSFGIADLLADDEEFRRYPARFSHRGWPLL